MRFTHLSIRNLKNLKMTEFILNIVKKNYFLYHFFSVLKSKCLYEVHFERDFSFWISQSVHRPWGKRQLDLNGFIFSRAEYPCPYAISRAHSPQGRRKYKVIQHIDYLTWFVRDNKLWTDSLLGIVTWHDRESQIIGFGVYGGETSHNGLYNEEGP